VEVLKNITLSMGLRLIIPELTLFAGGASGILVSRGARGARFQCVITLRHWGSHLRLKFEGNIDRGTKDEIVGNTTGSIQEDLGS